MALTKVIGAGLGSVSSADLDGALNVQGETTLQTHLNMGDSDIIKLGDSADLQIHHSSSGYSSIVDSGTGHLFIGGSEVNLMNPALNEYLLRAITDSSVSLYHDNSVKLATSNTGVNVTGGIGLGGTGSAKSALSVTVPNPAPITFVNAIFYFLYGL